MTRRLVVGSRGSKLALVQAELVVARLRELAPEHAFTISVVTTSGDRERKTRLDRMEGVGVFVKELEEALLNRRVDLAVHSLKDMPTDIPDGLALLAVTERQNPADVLVASAGLDDLPAGARIGTGSLRRGIELKRYRPDLEVCSIRGNVDTRLRKVFDGEVDGVILAAAAMIRLGREASITQYLPTEHFVPAVGQGALAIEARADDDDMAEMLSRLNDTVTWQCVTAERTFLRALGGGCRAPLAALATIDGNVLRLSGMAADPVGSRVLRAESEGAPDRATAIGARLAGKLAAMGASEFISKGVPR